MVSSTTEPVMTICSLAASSVCRSAASWVTSQPSRMPGRPYALDRLETLMTRSDRDAASGGSGPSWSSRYVSSRSSRAVGCASTMPMTAVRVASSMSCPVGLWGVVRLTRRVSGRSIAAMRSGSTAQASSQVRSRKLMSAPMARGVSRLVA